MSQHALARSLRAMTVGTLRAYNARQGAYLADAVGEVDQQYQVNISGSGSATVAWATLRLDFDAPFVDGSEERNVPFVYPMFTYGTVVTQGERLLVVCNVTSWTTDEDYVNGCTLEVGATHLEGGELGDFTAELHLNFQGWGAPNPAESDTEP